VDVVLGDPGVGARVEGVEIRDQVVELLIAQGVVRHQGAEGLAGGADALADGPLECLIRVGRTELGGEGRLAGRDPQRVEEDLPDDGWCHDLSLGCPDAAATMTAPTDDLLSGQRDVALDNTGHGLPGRQHAVHVHAPACLHFGWLVGFGGGGARLIGIRPGKDDRRQ
jgi:hypothetical protein